MSQWGTQHYNLWDQRREAGEAEEEIGKDASRLLAIPGGRLQGLAWGGGGNWGCCHQRMTSSLDTRRGESSRKGRLQGHLHPRSPGHLSPTSCTHHPPPPFLQTCIHLQTRLLPFPFPAERCQWIQLGGGGGERFFSREGCCEAKATAKAMIWVFFLGGVGRHVSLQNKEWGTGCRQRQQSIFLYPIYLFCYLLPHLPLPHPTFPGRHSRWTMSHDLSLWENTTEGVTVSEQGCVGGVGWTGV